MSASIDRLAGACKGVVGLAKQCFGRLTANRLLAFEGEQDRLEARLIRRARRRAPPGPGLRFALRAVPRAAAPLSPPGSPAAATPGAARD